MSDKNDQSNASGSYGGTGYGGAGYGGYDGGGGYGNYGGYYYGYNYGSGGYGPQSSPTVASRSLKDYLLIIRERIWYFIVVFFVIFVGVVVYTYNTREIYRSAAKVQILRDEREIIGRDIEDDIIRGAEDFNTQIQVLNSTTLIAAVAERIKDEEKERFMEPYQNSIFQQRTLQEYLANSRLIVPRRMTYVVDIMFDHPYPDVAMDVANYFADEYINQGIRLNIDTAMMAVEDLRVRVEQQKQEVEKIRQRMTDFRQETNRPSLDPNDNIESRELSMLQDMVTGSKQQLDETEVSWRLIQQAIAEGRPLVEDPIIAQSDRVRDLLKQRSQQRIYIETLKKRYGPKHPEMISANEQLFQTDAEINATIDETVRQLELNYESAKRRYEQANKRLANKTQEINELSLLQVQYKTMEDELLVAQGLYQAMESRLREQMARIALQGPSARVIDYAQPSARAHSPNYPLFFAGGLFGGVAAGVVVVFIIAFLDDRIKSAFDIENAVGLPLIGIVPRIKRMNSSEKAQAVATNHERRITESFRAIHSALRINESSKAAKITLITSTSPSEGKSFVVTNLALTYAIHGERTLVIDCDLRMPNIAKSLSLEEESKGVVHYFKKEATLDEAIIKDIYPNLDVMTAGKKSSNPTQILTSPAFEQMLNELAERYDRIMIDTPPIAAVSDVLTLLPYSDGVIYVIKFNAVKRKTAKSNLRRILESNTPVFGAVLNQISTAVASYYYSSYYDKSYSDYYGGDDSDESDELAPRRRETEEVVNS